MAPPGTRGPGRSRHDVRRVRWPAANLLVYTEGSGAVALWFATNGRAILAGESISREITSTFVPDEAATWVILTRQLLELRAPPVPGDTASTVLSGALRSLEGGALAAGRRRKRSSLESTVRLVLSPKEPRKALLFELRPMEVAALLDAMDSTASTSVYRPQGQAVEPSSASGTQVWFKSAAQSAPRYPPSLQAGWKEGEVWLRFVVGTDGRVEMDSIEIFLSDHRAFERAVRDWLRDARYEPATLGGKPVRQKVSQRFVFGLER